MNEIVLVRTRFIFLSCLCVKVIADLHAQLRQQEPEEKTIYVADSGLYSTANVLQLNQAGVRWVMKPAKKPKLP